MSTLKSDLWRQRLIAFCVPILLSAPFLHRAFFVDDSYFVQIASWLKENPGRPYDFTADDAGIATTRVGIVAISIEVGEPGVAEGSAAAILRHPAARHEPAASVVARPIPARPRHDALVAGDLRPAVGVGISRVRIVPARDERRARRSARTVRPHEPGGDHVVRRHVEP